MKVEFDKSFHKSILKLRNAAVIKQVADAIADVEKATTYTEINHFKKLTGYRDYYRIRIGDYRIGLKRIDATTLRFIVVAHRREVYRMFP